MPLTHQEPDGLDSKAWRDLQECASRLEQSLLAGTDPGDLRRFLPAANVSHRRAVLLELIKTYLEHLYRHQRGCLLEEFLRHYPELGPAEELPATLLHEEYRTRTKFGDRPDLTEYRARFPLQFEQFCQLVRQDGPSPASSPPATIRTMNAQTSPGDPPAAPSPAPAGNSGSLILAGGEGYHLLERLGKGEFGEVYRALAPGGVAVAVKRIFRPMNDELSQRELRALKKVSEIRHPFLLQTHNFQALGDHLVIVMELADGSLADRFQECRAAGRPGIPADELLRYFTEAAEALDFLCREKLSHRDIKPANLLHVKGHAKVADFGIARTQTASVDQTLNFAGTPAYMAPEVWRREISVHSDQYSLAATWFEMRTGRRVFTGQSLPEVALQHINSPPDLSGVPEAEQEVVRRALAKAPDERFNSCTEFVQALKKALEPPPPPPRKVGRGVKVLVACLLGLSLGAIPALVSLARKPPPGQTVVEPPKSLVEWQPTGWEPAGLDERVETDWAGKRFYRTLRRDFGGQSVVLVLVPRTGQSDPDTFYMMENKVWNDLYRAFLADPESENLLIKYSKRREGCAELVKGEWQKGASAPGRPGGGDLGVGPGRGRVPVFRATATEAVCVAEWMGGRLPSKEQYLKAAGVEEVPPPGVYEGNVEGLAVGLGSVGPWTVDQGTRDVIGFGCRQLVTNGKEFTRSLGDGTDELPLKSMLAVRYVCVVGKSYLSASPPAVADLRSLDSIRCTEASYEVGFRVVFEKK